jgi:hypothetical protein
MQKAAAASIHRGIRIQAMGLRLKILFWSWFPVPRARLSRDGMVRKRKGGEVGSKSRNGLGRAGRAACDGR